MSKLWGGRFSKKTDPLVEKFTKSIHYDCKLVEYDLLGSIAHVAVLKAARYLAPDESAKLRPTVCGDFTRCGDAGVEDWAGQWGRLCRSD